MVGEFCTLLMVASVVLMVCDIVEWAVGRFSKMPEVKRPVFDAPPAQARVIGIIGRDSEADSVIDSVLSRKSFDFGDEIAERTVDRMLSRHGF